jgi:hypothetical protein
MEIEEIVEESLGFTCLPDHVWKDFSLIFFHSLLMIDHIIQQTIGKRNLIS